MTFEPGALMAWVHGHGTHPVTIVKVAHQCAPSGDSLRTVTHQLDGNKVVTKRPQVDHGEDLDDRPYIYTHHCRAAGVLVQFIEHGVAYGELVVPAAELLPVELGGNAAVALDHGRQLAEALPTSVLMVLDMFLAAGADGLCDHEHDPHYSTTSDTVRAAREQLEKAHLVDQSVQHREHRGHQARVYTVTALGALVAFGRKVPA